MDDTGILQSVHHPDFGLCDNPSHICHPMSGESSLLIDIPLHMAYTLAVLLHMEQNLFCSSLCLPDRHHVKYVSRALKGSPLQH